MVKEFHALLNLATFHWMMHLIILSHNISFMTTTALYNIIPIIHLQIKIICMVRHTHEHTNTSNFTAKETYTNNLYV